MARFVGYQFCVHSGIWVDIDKIASIPLVNNRTDHLASCPNTTKAILPNSETFNLSISFIVTQEYFPDREIAYSYSNENTIWVYFIGKLIDNGACLQVLFHLSLKKE